QRLPRSQGPVRRERSLYDVRGVEGGAGPDARGVPEDVAGRARVGAGADAADRARDSRALRLQVSVSLQARWIEAFTFPSVPLRGLRGGPSSGARRELRPVKPSGTRCARWRARVRTSWRP